MCCYVDRILDGHSADRAPVALGDMNDEAAAATTQMPLGPDDKRFRGNACGATSATASMERDTVRALDRDRVYLVSVLPHRRQPWLILGVLEPCRGQTPMTYVGVG